MIANNFKDGSRNFVDRSSNFLLRAHLSLGGQEARSLRKDLKVMCYEIIDNMMRLNLVTIFSPKDL